jgi:hypothetical protein
LQSKEFNRTQKYKVNHIKPGTKKANFEKNMALIENFITLAF